MKAQTRQKREPCLCFYSCSSVKEIILVFCTHFCQTFTNLQHEYWFLFDFFRVKQVKTSVVPHIMFKCLLIWNLMPNIFITTYFKDLILQITKTTIELFLADWLWIETSLRDTSLQCLFAFLCGNPEREQFLCFCLPGASLAFVRALICLNGSGGENNGNLLKVQGALPSTKTWVCVCHTQVGIIIARHQLSQ